MMVPAAIRYKNPGAMWPGAIATKWGSTKWVYLNDGTGQGGGGHGNKIAIFDTWVQGICAQLDLWRTSPKYSGKRFADAIAVWSGGNYVNSYIAYVLARVPGMARNTVMNDQFWQSPMGLQFLKAQSHHEAGKAIPAPDADWIEAQHIVFGMAPPAWSVARPMLRSGSIGETVKELQKLLGIRVDAIFGRDTKDAVMKFQRLHGLVTDGVVGKMTWKALEQKDKLNA